MPAAAAGVSYSVTATIPVGHQPTGVAIASAFHRVYVPNFADRTLSVIDTASNTVVGTVPLTYQPSAVAVDTVSNPVAKAAVRQDLPHRDHVRGLHRTLREQARRGGHRGGGHRRIGCGTAVPIHR